MELHIQKINNKCQKKLNNLYNFLKENLKTKFIFPLNTMYFIDGKMWFKAFFNLDSNLDSNLELNLNSKLQFSGVYIMIDTTHVHHYYYSIPVINTRLIKNYLFINNEELQYTNNDYHKFDSNEEVLNELNRIYEYIT
jgi:hypothetical protein